MNSVLQITSEYMRSVLSRGLTKLGLSMDEYIITERTLVLEAVLQAGTNKYTFNLRDNGTGRPLEQRLNQNDTFLMSHIGLGIRKFDDVAGNYGNYPLFHNPDGNYFVGASEAFALETIYNGVLSFKSPTVNVIDEFNTMHLRQVPERGYMIAAAPQVADELPTYGPSCPERGLYPYALNWAFDGQSNNTVELTIGQGDTSQIAGGIDAGGAVIATKNVVTLLIHGFEIAQYNNVAVNGKCGCA